ncbi:MAG: hypothetical protein ACK5WD_11145 [bacterium]
MLPSPQVSSPRVLTFFSAITSAMQPTRLPLALLAVLLVTALAPVIDLAAGKSFGTRGFTGGVLGETDLEIDRSRARSAAIRFAGLEVAALENPADGAASADADRRDPSTRELVGAVREGLVRRIGELRAATDEGDAGWRASEERRLRQAAAQAIRQIEESAPRGVASVFLENERQALRQIGAAVVDLDLEAAASGVLSAVFTVPAAAIRASPVVFPLAALVMLSLLAICAGGLCRMAAVHSGRDGRLSTLEGSAFARGRAVNLASLPVLPAAVLLILGIIVFVFVLLLRVPVLNVVGGALFVVPLLVAILGAVLAIVAIAAAPLMPAAVAVEDCDAGDSITRSCALVLSRPLFWLCVLAVAIVALVIGTLLVTGVLTLASNAIAGLLAFAGGDAGAVIASGDSAMIATLSGPDRLVALFVGFWMGLLEAVGAAYAFSLSVDLATRGYLLMRARIDGESPSTVAGYGVG